MTWGSYSRYLLCVSVQAERTRIGRSKDCPLIILRTRILLSSPDISAAAVSVPVKKPGAVRGHANGARPMTGRRSAEVRKAVSAQRYLAQYSANRRRPLLERCIALFEDSLPGVPEDHPMMAIFLSDFGSAKRGWFELTLERGALDDALQLGRRAVALSQAPQPRGNPVSPGCLLPGSACPTSVSPCT